MKLVSTGLLFLATAASMALFADIKTQDARAASAEIAEPLVAQTRLAAQPAH